MNANKRYIDEIALEPILSFEEEAKLAEEIKFGSAKALEKLTKANLKYVVSLAHQYKHEGIALDDLISEGNIGLMYAAQKYDAQKGIRFVKYAASYIRKAMEDVLKEYNISYKLSSKSNHTSKKKQARTLSIDQPIPEGGSGNFTLQNLIKNTNSPLADEALNQELLKENILKGLTVLNEREKKVIILIYGLLHREQRSMAEVGDILGLKRERVRQIRNSALRKLYKSIR